MDFNKICYCKDGDIFFEYSAFKELATTDNCITIIQHFINIVITEALLVNSTYNIHLNVTNLKITDIEKYFKFFQTYNILSIPIANKMTTCHIYNAPSSFKTLYQIASTFINKNTMNKINICT